MSQSTNTFGLMRLALSLIVILSHGMILTGNAEFVTFHTKNYMINLGSIAVAGFFAISGYLLTSSVLRNSASNYLLNRFLRIFPGYIICLITTAYALFMFDKFNPNKFIHDTPTHEKNYYLYVVQNLFLIQLDKTSDVFRTNPYPEVINGSLWSLFPEFFCYMLLLIFTMTLRGNQIRMFAITAICVVLVIFLTFLMAHSSHARFFLQSVFQDQTQEWLSLFNVLISFLFGVFSSLMGDRILTLSRKRFRFFSTMGLSIATIYFFSLPYYFIGSILFSFFVIILGNMYMGKHVSRIGGNLDLSFGLFLYHFPIMQILIVLNPPLFGDPITLLFSSLPLALLFAFLSWTFIEKPSKRFTKRS